MAQVQNAEELANVAATLPDKVIKTPEGGRSRYVLDDIRDFYNTARLAARSKYSDLDFTLMAKREDFERITIAFEKARQNARFR